MTGVNISQYTGGLAKLLEYLCSGTSRIRIRLSSIEPELYDSAFIRAVSHERIRPHFHFSLQSGSEKVLSRMKRLYTPKEAEKGIKLLKEAKGDPFLGCDIITGFPGESREEFEKTYDFCKKIGFAGIHVFPFSRRPGTEAWDFKDRVTEKEAGLRAEALSYLAHNNREAYIKRWTGKTIEALVEEEEGPRPDYVPALSANYIKLRVLFKNRPRPKAGTLLLCRIIKDTAIPGGFEQKNRECFDVMAEIL